MASVCLYFQLHQPFRLRRYSVFDAHAHYFDDEANTQILRSVAQKCYLPAGRLLLKLVQQHDGAFRLAFSLTGCIIEQLERFAPDVLDVFRSLAETGCCEFLSETYHHSLASLYSPEEFEYQVEQHDSLIEDLFGQVPTIFRNTELIYSNDLADMVAKLGRFQGILVEGADHVLKGRTPNQPYTPPNHSNLTLLLKNYRLSDDVAFRFSDHSWPHWPLSVRQYADWIHETSQTGPICNLFMDFETFGEHQRRETGIFDFLESLPGAVLERGDEFRTPSEIVELHEPADSYDVPSTISWADTERDVSAWLGNAMQSSALQEFFKLEQMIKAADSETLLSDWRKLSTSDHFYYMCTKYFADGDVHKYFNPYESPYDSYINFMNVLDNLRTRAEQQPE